MTRNDKSSSNRRCTTKKARPAKAGAWSCGQGEKILEVADDVDLFHTPEREAYASISVDSHREHWPLGSDNFKYWLHRRYYLRFGSVPNHQTFKSALEGLKGRALYDGPEQSVFTRIAERDGTIYLDLANDSWECVAIGRDGWEIMQDPPVRFRRPPGMGSLPHPERKGDRYRLRPFINVGSDSDCRLISGWLLGCLRPSGPYVILEFCGEQGSAKSETSRILRSLIDPNTASLRSQPRSLQDLMISARNGWVLAFDNISYLRADLSDALCRLSTGGGFGTRTLYTTEGETIFEAARPILLNGIGEVVVRSDLLDRTIVVHLPRISDCERRREDELRADFEQERPAILGGLLDAVVCALRDDSEGELPDLPRMADAAAWVTAAEPALGWEPGTFIRDYRANMDSANQTALEANPVAGEILRFSERGPWTGTTTELLEALNLRVPVDLQHTRAWPKLPHLLSRTLRRIAPNLRAAGLEVEFTQTGGSGSSKIISLFRNSSDATDASDAAPGLPGVDGVAGVANEGADDCRELIEI